jgi:hypothetical protein
MGPVLGGLGIGIVWGWLLVAVAAHAYNRPIATGLGLGLASVLLAGGIDWLAGWQAAGWSAVAAGVGAIACHAFRAEQERARGTRG